ncbi:MAG: ATP-binding protein [Candidatus Cloacimonetes bacterium]|nr:ATP-binding protein [Candidatus Cloacimonadota bacterium]
MSKNTVVSMKEIQEYCQYLVIKYAVGMELWKQNDSHAIGFCYNLLSVKECEKLVKTLNTSIKKRYVKRADSLLIEDYSDEDDVVSSLTRLFKKNKLIFKQYQKFIESALRTVDHLEPVGFPNLEKVVDIYGLNPKEAQLVELYCCIMIENSLEEFLESKSWFESIHTVSRMLGFSDNEVMRMLDESGKLVQAGILDKSFRGTYDIETEVAMYVIGSSELDKNISAAKEVNGLVYELDSFNIKPLEKIILTNILTKGNGCRILFHGAPGTGKTELAKSVSRVTGKSAYYLDLLENDKPVSRFQAILMVKNKLKAGDILIIDEAESLLTSQNPFMPNVDKAQINGLLDDFATMNTIWIVNYRQSIDLSTLRRFDYNLEFKPLTDEQRKRFWKNALIAAPGVIQLSDKDIEELSQKYPVDSGSISSAFKLLGFFNQDNHKEVLNELLSRSLFISSANASSERRSQVSKFYDLSVLNTDCNIADVVKSTQRFLQKPGLNVNGLKMLLHGLPGTGKTEFAKYLAAQCGKKLFIRNLSDILSKWVGETEQNIAAIFKEAESTNAILLLDESDALFTARTGSLPPWEISKTNELLKQVENFNSVLICATNLIDTLDKASLRRFHWKIEFMALTSESRIKIFEKYFPEHVAHLTGKVKAELCRIEGLTPGSFSIVKQRAMLLDRVIPIEELIQQIMNEASYQNSQKKAESFRIGFSA